MSEQLKIMQEAERLLQFGLAWQAKITMASTRILTVADRRAEEKDKSKIEYIDNVRMPSAERERALAILGEAAVRKMAGEHYQEHASVYQEEALRMAKEARYPISGWGGEESQIDGFAA